MIHRNLVIVECNNTLYSVYKLQYVKQSDYVTLFYRRWVLHSGEKVFGVHIGRKKVACIRLYLGFVKARLMLYHQPQ